MYYIVDSKKSFEVAAADLESAVKRHAFGLMHVHDMGSTLRSKGVLFEDECKVFEICDPVQASKVLSIDMRLNMALPCRISIYTDKEKLRIGMIKPIEMLSALSQDAALIKLANEVEEQMIQIIDETK